jgi:hypothetical protein
MLYRLAPAWSGALGLPLLGAGLALAISCIVVFVLRGQGTPAPFDSPRKLVAVGPYRYMRNPMYTGGVLALLGFGLLQASPSMVVFVPVWWLLFHFLVLLYEEPLLRAKFGRDYENYCRQTPRWVPRFTRRLVGASVLLLASAALVTAQSQPNFTGEWKLNRDKSDFGVLSPPDRRIDVIRHDGPVLELTSRHSRRDHETVGEWKCRTDSGACTVSLTGVEMKLATRVVWRGSPLVLESEGEYMGGQVRATDRWTLSTDGNTLTIARRMSNQTGETHQNLVFEKQ